MAGKKVWAVDDVLTASDVNSYLGDQTVIICTSTTRPSNAATGQLISETDTGLLWRWNGSAWAAPYVKAPYAYGTNPSGPAIGSGSWTLCSTNAVEANSWTFTGSHVVCNQAGLYRVSGGLVAGSGSGSWAVDIRKNSAGSNTGGSRVAFGSSASAGAVVDAVTTPPVIARLAANDYLELFVWQNSGTAVTLATDSTGLHIEATWVAP